jgi:rhamnulokinase
MPDRIASFCRETGQTVPETKGAILRCALESLALLYRKTLQDIETMTGNRVDVLHIVGGGSRNRLLNQWTANALNRKVVTGPIEATAAGNILIQALALGHLDSIEDARKVISKSFPTETFEPVDQSKWDKKVDRVVPDPRCGLREGDGGSNVHCVPRSARAWFRKAMRIACQGRPALP